ncbi:MAG: hypothetical protein AB7F89_01005 [Pirellulaceae bacterium]
MFKKQLIGDQVDSAPYMVRWNFALPLGYSLKLHLILRTDDNRCAHDHPWNFLRVILWGGYYEQCDPHQPPVLRKPWRPWAPWRLYWCGRKFRHRITSLPHGSSCTLVLAGPREREWGYFTRDGWVDWRSFASRMVQRHVLWCDDGRKLNEDDERADMGVVIREMRKRPWNLE